MKPWMWLALAGGVIWWLAKSGKLQTLTPQGEPEKYTPPIPYNGRPPDFIDLPQRGPLAGDEEFVDVGEQLVKQLYGYSVAPRADQVRYNGSH